MSSEIVNLPNLLGQLRGLIQSARRQALRAVDALQVRTCWEIGRHIVEYEQKGADRAAYGARLIATLAETLTAEFGRGFDASNLRYMRLFYQAFPIHDALRHELSWTHYRTLLRVEQEQARLWYMNETAEQNWSTRALDRQIGTLYYERLLASHDREPLRQEAATNIAPLQQSPREFVRDPVLLEFLGLPETGRLLEADLEQALIDKLQGFLLEPGKGFAFVARQMRISTESKDFYIDLKAGELEITDLNRLYLEQGKLNVEIMGRGYVWLDTGAHESLLDASQFIASMEHHQGFKVPCLEEIAYRQQWIDAAQFESLAQPLVENGYGRYQLSVIKEPTLR